MAKNVPKMKYGTYALIPRLLSFFFKIQLAVDIFCCVNGGYLILLKKPSQLSDTFLISHVFNNTKKQSAEGTGLQIYLSEER